MELEEVPRLAAVAVPVGVAAGLAVTIGVDRLGRPLVVVLVVINGALSGSEMALISLRESQLRRLERTSRSGRVLAELARDPNRFLATIQVGITWQASSPRQRPPYRWPSH